MAQFIHHPAALDPAGSAHSWSQVPSRIATWVWPPIENEVAARQDGVDPAPQDSDAPAWSTTTMHWVPLVVPLTALGMLVMAVLIGSRL